MYFIKLFKLATYVLASLPPFQALDQDGNPVLLHKIEEASDDAATSLIELSQSSQEGGGDAGTVDTVVEISGDQGRNSIDKFCFEF